MLHHMSIVHAQFCTHKGDKRQQKRIAGVRLALHEPVRKELEAMEVRTST